MLQRKQVNSLFIIFCRNFKIESRKTQAGQLSLPLSVTHVKISKLTKYILEHLICIQTKSDNWERVLLKI